MSDGRGLLTPQVAQHPLFTTESGGKKVTAPNIDAQSFAPKMKETAATHAKDLYEARRAKNAAKWAARYEAGHVTPLCPTYDILRG